MATLILAPPLGSALPADLLRRARGASERISCEEVVAARLGSDQIAVAFRGRGSQYPAQTLPFDVEKLVLFLEGGGACWDELTCYSLQTAANITTGFGEPQLRKRMGSVSGGLFDRASATNPFKDASFVYVPYCTGDVHAGELLDDEAVEAFVRENQVLMLPHDPLGATGDGFEHEGGDRRVFKIGGLTDERVLLRRHSNLQAVSPGGINGGIAHGSILASSGQCPDAFTSRAGRRVGG